MNRPRIGLANRHRQAHLVERCDLFAPDSVAETCVGVVSIVPLERRASTPQSGRQSRQEEGEARNAMHTLKENQASRLRASFRAILDSRLVGQSVQLCSDATRDAGLGCIIRRHGVRRQGGAVSALSLTIGSRRPAAGRRPISGC
jgi:hypothetical protein